MSDDDASAKAVAAYQRHGRLEGKSDRTVYERGLTLERVARQLGTWQRSQ